MYKNPYDKVKEDVLRDMSVTAGAGAGKTTSMMKRYLEIVTSAKADGKRYSPSDITAVTFTRKASLEMKEKITHEVLKKLDESLEKRDEKSIRFYKGLKDELLSAEISTLHSLCANILREHPHIAKVDPDFTLLDEKKSGILLEEVIVESILTDLKSASSNSAMLINSYGFNGTISIIKRLFHNPYLTGSVLKELPDEKSSLIGDEKRLHDTYSHLREFYLKVKKRHDREKNALSALDFNDLEIIAKRVLESDSRIRRHYQNKIKFLMVDEFQDTNPVQKEIIYLLGNLSGRDDSKKRPYLFVVGDPKQSIYRFRNADVEIFNSVKRDLGGDDSAIYLLKNFRSHKKIVDFINVFFDMYMSERERDFQTGYEPIIAVRDDEPEGEISSRVKCLFFDADTVSGELKGNAPLKTVPGSPLTANMKELRKFEACLLANEIENLVNSDRKVVFEDKETLRKTRYGDIMVLFSALTNVELYTRELKRKGIPFSVSSGTTYYNRLWIHDLINLLKSAENIYDDVALCGLLRSPFVLLKDSTLFLISLSEGLSFYEKLVNTFNDEGTPDKVDPAEMEKLRFATELIDEMRLLRARLTIREFIEYFINKTGYLYVMQSTSDGEILLNDVNEFLSIADSSDIARDNSTRKFIEYITLLQKIDAKLTVTHDKKDDDKVKIMSIHAAKGLQSKVVIVPDLGREPNKNLGRILLNKGYPPGIKIRADDQNKLKDTETHSTLSELEKQKRDAESKRLLYVAATRAEDYLIFLGPIKFDKGANKNEMKITDVKKWIDAFRYLFEIHSPSDIPEGDKVIEQEIEFIESADGNGKKEKVRVKVEFEKVLDVNEKEKADESFVNEFKENFKNGKIICTAEAEYGDKLKNIFEKRAIDKRFEYNVTMLNSFKRCKRLYYFKYLLGIPEYGFLDTSKGYGKRNHYSLDPAVKGNIMHKVLELWDYRVDGYENHLNNVLRDMSVEIKDDDRQKIKKLLHGFSSSETVRKLKESDYIKKEASFATLISGRKIISKIDCLYRHEKRWYVLDYKTESVVDMSESVKRYERQLNIYGMAAGMSLGIDNVTAEIYFLEPDTVESFEIDVNKVKDETKKLIDEIESYDHSLLSKEIKTNENCETCGYASFCPHYVNI